DQRPVGGVLRQAAERVRVREEERHVVEAADVDVAHHDVGVVEVKRVVDGVRVRRRDQQDRGGARQEEAVTCHYRGLRKSTGRWYLFIALESRSNPLAFGALLAVAAA